MYHVRFGPNAKKRLKKLKKSGSFPQSKLEAAIRLLRNGMVLPRQYGDHALQGKLEPLREFHVSFDFLVVYKKNELLHVVTIVDLGSHPEVFGD